MHRSIHLTFALALACMSVPEADDEVGTTSEESTTSTSGDGPAAETSNWSHDNGISFIDTGDPDLASSCDPFMQDCPEGEKCVAYSRGGDNWDANHCVPVQGDQAPGEPCMYDGWAEGTDDCDATSSCLTTAEDGEGVCHPLCMGTADATECPPMLTCININEGSITLCLAPCDPILQNCPEGQACHWAATNFACLFPGTDIPLGEPCDYINDCAPGNFCTAMSILPECAAASCCANHCDLELGDVQCSEPGTVCIGFFEPSEAPPGYEHVGVCILPP